MKKHTYQVWAQRAKQLIHTLRFSTLDAETKTYVSRELFYFNHSRSVAIAWVILVLEAFNIGNVLFLSRSGLATENNRQYFTMYLLLMASGVLCLVARRLLKHRRAVLARCYVGFTAFWLGWHAVLSSMDLRRNPSITVFISGVFSLSLLVRLKPGETLTILPGSLLLLMLCAGNTLGSGIAINALIVTAVAVLISCSRYFSTLEELGYRRKLVLQANHRASEQQALTRLRIQQAALLRHSRELLFLWDSQTGELTLSGATVLSGRDEAALLKWLSSCAQLREGALALDGQGRSLEYQVSCTPVWDSVGTLAGAAGRVGRAETV